MALSSPNPIVSALVEPRHRLVCSVTKTSRSIQLSQQEDERSCSRSALESSINYQRLFVLVPYVYNVSRSEPTSPAPCDCLTGTASFTYFLRYRRRKFCRKVSMQVVRVPVRLEDYLKLARFLLDVRPCTVLCFHELCGVYRPS